jgi:replicative DNA helicase
MVSEPAVGLVVDDVKLKVSDFYGEAHRVIYSAMVGLHAAGSPIDQLTVVEALRDRGLLDAARGENFVFGLVDQVNAPGNVRAHAVIVADLARWRGRQEAGFKILEGVKNRDVGLVGEAEGLLTRQVAHQDSEFNRTALMAVARGLAVDGGGESFRYPFEELNRFTAGGMRRGEFLLIAGHESHGKTVFLDQTLDHLYGQGTRTQLYLTEMTIPERVARTMSRSTGISFERIMEQRMSEAEAARYEAGIENAIKVGMTDATGWTVDEIAADIRAKRWDVAAIDTVHDIPHEDTRDLERIARTLATTSRQARCVMIGVAHVNRARVKQAQAPRPTRGDILGSGQFAKSANTVCFVHRAETKKGIPTLDGWVFFSKVRNGRLGEVEVTLNPSRYRFEKRLRDGDPGPTPPNEVAEQRVEESPLPF